MWNFIQRLLGWRCCGQWSKWSRYRARYSRQPIIGVDSAAFTSGDLVFFTEEWQERHCLECGRIQQRKLQNQKGDLQ